MTGNESIGAVIVNYKTKEHVARCVASLRDEGVEEIIVVDNASFDGVGDLLAEVDPKVHFIQSERNLGLGGGTNLGAASSRSPLLLIINPDTKVHAGAMATLRAALDANPTVGLVGPRLQNPDGTLYPSARVFPSRVDAAGHVLLGLFFPNNPFTRRYKMLDADMSHFQLVDWVSGACWLLRREAFDSVSGFDDSYFMYMEDYDLCRRLQKAGWKIAYEPAAVVDHVGGASTGQKPYKMLWAHTKSVMRYTYRTTTGPARVLLPFATAALIVRTGLAFGKRALQDLRS